MGFQWLFSWLQLRTVLEAEPSWVAFISAAFVPFALIAVGYTQALLAGRLDNEVVVAAAAKRETKKKQIVEEQVAKQEFAQENHTNRRAPNPAAYKVMARDGWKCFYCGMDMSDWSRDEIHVDHFCPVASGGSDDPLNLVVSCGKCNLSKGSRAPSADEIRQLKIHLVKTLDTSTKEKVWLLQNIVPSLRQKDIASILEVSPSYVSASLRKLPDELSERLKALCVKLGRVGKPSPSPSKETDK